MSSFDRRRFLVGPPALIAAAVLSGCGFTPAYGPSGSAGKLLNAVEVSEPKGRAGYLMTRELEDRLGRAGQPRYALVYAIEVSETPVAISRLNLITRYNLLGKVTYALNDLATDQVLTSGTVDNFTSFAASDTTVATEAARRAAEERIVVILSDQVVARLVAAADSFET
ncbi:LPS assembly lipoprotein LptE [Roseovarius sp.]|jgi:LPS-assembly lipoprotein